MPVINEHEIELVTCGMLHQQLPSLRPVYWAQLVAYLTTILINIIHVHAGKTTYFTHRIDTPHESSACNALLAWQGTEQCNCTFSAILCEATRLTRVANLAETDEASASTGITPSLSSQVHLFPKSVARQHTPTCYHVAMFLFLGSGFVALKAF